MVGKISKAIRDPRKVFSLLKYEFLKSVGHREYKRFILLSRSRTGSNMLRSLLGSHPNIYLAGEIFQVLKERDYKAVLDGIFSKQPRNVQAAGFKIFYDHPWDDHSGRLWEDLVAMQGLHVIHLGRRNILRTLLSSKIAKAQGMWVAGNGESNAARNEKGKLVEFSVKELEEGFNQTTLWQEEARKKFGAHAMLEIHYEDLVASPKGELERILRFLGLPLREMRTGLRKQNPEKLSELIVNYTELAKAFSGTEWGGFFVD